jgi:hypothetical protein
LSSLHGSQPLEARNGKSSQPKILTQWLSEVARQGITKMEIPAATARQAWIRMAIVVLVLKDQVASSILITATITTAWTGVEDMVVIIATITINTAGNTAMDPLSCRTLHLPVLGLQPL